MSGIVILYALTILLISGGMMVIYFKMHHIMRPNVISVMYLFHIATQFTPSLILMSYTVKYPAANTYFYACSLIALIIPVGALFANLLFPKSLRKTSFLSTNDSTILHKSNNFIKAYGLFCLILFIVFLFIAPQSPLMLLLTKTGGHEEVLSLRREISQMSYIFSLGRVFLMPLMLIILVYHWQKTSPPLYKAISIAMVLIIILYAAYPSSKTQLVMLFVLLGFSWHIKWAQIKEQSKKIPPLYYAVPIALCGVIISYPVLIFILKPFGQNSDIATILYDGIFKRIFFRPALNAYYAFEIFPNLIPFTDFTDIKKLSILMNWDSFPLAQRTAMYSKGLISSSPPPSIGAFYAEGGLKTVIIGGFIASALFKTLENILLSSKLKTPIEFALYTMLLYGAFRFSWSYFHTILLSESIVPIILIWCLYQIYREKTKKYLKYL